MFAIVVALGACGRKTSQQVHQTPAPPPSLPPTQAPASSAQSSRTPVSSFAEAAQQVRGAVVIVTVFDDTGNLTANGHGFFISDDGKFVADRSILTGGVNAVAKAANGAIYNVSGALSQTPAQSFVLLKADVPQVPFLVPSAGALPDMGGSVAVVLSPVESTRTLVLEAKITGRFSDQLGEWFDVAPTLPKTALGAPVINHRGEVVGIVAWRRDGQGSCAIRPANQVSALLAQVTPNMIATWHVRTLPSPSPTPSVSAVKSPSPGKIVVRGSKLLFAPAPRYPQKLRVAHWRARGSGSYRIMFNAQGRATNVEVVRSTGNQLLDDAALSALREWRAYPSSDWSLVVPITFEP